MQKRLLFVAFLLLAICNKIVADDQLTVSNVSMYPGDSKEVSIELTNAESYVGFQFDLYLPNGITIESYSRSSRIPDGTTLEMAQQTDGGYRFIAAGLGGNAITGNEGAVMTITLKSADAIALNDYTAYLRNVMVSKADGSGINVVEQSFTVTISERPHVATPTFTHTGNVVTITTTPTNASIYYTTDGSTPTRSSTLYTDPITMTQNCTVKAIAVADGYDDSEVATYVVDWISEVLTETFVVTKDFTPTGGQEIQVTDNVKILFGEDTWVHNDFSGIDYPNGWTFVYGPNKPVDVNGDLYSLRKANLPVTGSFIKITPNKSGSLRVKQWIHYDYVFYLVDGNTGFATSEFDLIDDRSNVDVIILDDSCRVTEETTRRKAPRRSLNIGFGGVSCNFNVEANHSYYLGCPNGATFYGVEFADTIAIINDATTNRCRKIIADSHITDVAISIVEKTLYITSETPNATIYYTTDGSTPTTSSTLYTGPITPTQNCTVKAIAVADGYEDSEVATYVVDWFKVADVTFVQNGNQVTLNTATEDAIIHYTLSNNSEAGEQTCQSGTVLTMAGDCTITAWATREGYTPSKTTIFEFHAGGVTCGNPVFARRAGTDVVTVSTSTEGATIHYTIGDSIPTAESNIFPADGLTVYRNQTINAIALRDSYYPSQVARFEVDWFKVAPVEFAQTGRQIALQTLTADAAIHYTLSNNSEAGEQVYTAPLMMTGDCTITAWASREGYNNSDTLRYHFVAADVTVAKPVIVLNGNKAGISTTTENAIIHYTLDGTTPTADSPVYVDSITVDGNIIISAIAMREYWFDSEVAVYSTENLFPTEAPEFTFNGNVLTISAINAEHIYYAFEDGDYTEYTEPVRLTDNRTVKAYATRSGYGNSDVTTFTPDWFACANIQVRYDGRHLQLSSTDGAAIYYTLDGTEPTEQSMVFDGEIAIGGLLTVRAFATKQYLNNSAPLTYEIPAYYVDGVVVVHTAGQMSMAFGWMNEMPESLTVNGNLNQNDFRFLRSVNPLRHLNLAGTTIENGQLADATFANMDLVSIELPVGINVVGNNLFIGCNRLAAIIWNANVKLTAEAVSGLDNPNLLLYVNRGSLAPASITNVISSSLPATITLTDVGTGGNFYCPRDFKAGNISYTHNFTMKTQDEGTAGWESLALPFDVQSVTHEENGELVPFMKWTGEGDDRSPFWLYRFNSTDGEDLFVKTDKIEANTPYIISMPNNENYADYYNQRGLVTFSAKNVTVQKTELNILYREGTDYSMVPCYEYTPQAPGLSVINMEAVNIEGKDYVPGSVFVENLRDVRPFEAYIRYDVSPASRILELFDQKASGIEEITTVMAGDIVKVYTLSGLPVMKGRQSEVMRHLPKGVYIINGRKHVVR